MIRVYDRATFFRHVRASVFRGRLSPAQVEGMEALLTVWERQRIRPSRQQLAYCLATAWHETAHTMQPVRETLARSERQAIARLRKWARKLPARRRKTVLAYAKVHADTGHAYFGRGYVQITWRRNYRRLGLRLGIDLERNPELAMQPEIAARILIVGMLEGLFTGRRLGEFVNGDKCDYVGARQVVNGRDKARLIAGAAAAFERALEDAAMANVAGAEISGDEKTQETVKKAVVNPVPAPPPEVAEAEIPTSHTPPQRSTTIFSALLALAALAAESAGVAAGMWWWLPLCIGGLALAWIIKERIRHAWEDGV